MACRCSVGEDHVSVSGDCMYFTDYYGLLTDGTLDVYGTINLSYGLGSKKKPYASEHAEIFCKLYM